MLLYLPMYYVHLPTVLSCPQKQPVTCTTPCWPRFRARPLCCPGLVDWRIVVPCLIVCLSVCLSVRPSMPETSTSSSSSSSSSSRSKLINVRARSVHSPFLPAPHLATLAHGILWSSMCVQLHTGQRETKSFEEQFTSPHFGPEKP
jgi:hypothetical protein